MDLEDPERFLIVVAIMTKSFWSYGMTQKKHLRNGVGNYTDNHKITVNNMTNALEILLKCFASIVVTIALIGIFDKAQERNKKVWFILIPIIMFFWGLLFLAK